MKSIETKYGVIYGRNALILLSTGLNLHPFTLNIKASLSLSACKPEVINVPDETITFIFEKIEHLSIYKLDDYPNEKYTNSSFDEIEGEYKNNKKRFALTTYDHVFDVIGHCKVIY